MRPNDFMAFLETSTLYIHNISVFGKSAVCFRMMWWVAPRKSIHIYNYIHTRLLIPETHGKQPRFLAILQNIANSKNFTSFHFCQWRRKSEWWKHKFPFRCSPNLCFKICWPLLIDIYLSRHPPRNFHPHNMNTITAVFWMVAKLGRPKGIEEFLSFLRTFSQEVRLEKRSSFSQRLLWAVGCPELIPTSFLCEWLLQNSSANTYASSA